MQILPSIRLSGFIRHYLFLKKESPEARKLRLFSDGSCGIVFHSGHNIHLPNAFVYGQVTDFKDIDCYGPTELFIIVFRPDGLSRLFRCSAGELKDQVIALPDWLGPQGRTLQDAILNSPHIDQKIAHIERFFDHLTPIQNPLLTASLALIQQERGLLPIHRLAKLIGYHPRHLERLFTNTIGLSPKKFGNIVRIHLFLKQLHPQNASLTQCAYDSGFYDQAHLIREFKGFTGLTPSQYLKNTTPLATNFLQLA